MPRTWRHPKLGEFRYDALDWARIVSVPAFKAFSYDTGYPNARRSRGKHGLMFEADDENDLPSPAAVALAEKVLANQGKLVAKVRDALWDDFNGRGPKTGNWWHGDLDTVAEQMADSIGPPPRPRPPKSADDVLKLMRLSYIRVGENVHGDVGLVAELSFHAPFEEEHGVAVLTDGERILGIGYTADVVPFKPQKRRKPAKRRPSRRSR